MKSRLLSEEEYRSYSRREAEKAAIRAENSNGPLISAMFSFLALLITSLILIFIML